MSNDHTTFMTAAIEFARNTNPIWPFGAVIANAKGKILCKATDCAFISPLFHAEALAIHALISHNLYRDDEQLTLYDLRAGHAFFRRYLLGKKNTRFAYRRGGVRFDIGNDLKIVGFRHKHQGERAQRTIL